MAYTDEQFAKLPKWAQQEINRLWDRCEYLTSQLDEMAVADGPLSHSDHLKAVGIPENNRIHAKVEGGTIDITLRDGMLRINASHNALRIQPGATNQIFVWCERYR